jgi:CRP/FNR family transcriptional regulator, cyclic AMP receptor protein
VSTGDVLGEMSFLDSRPTSATVSAIGEAVVLEVATDEIRWHLEDDPGFGARFYRALALVLSGKMRSFTLVGAVDGDEKAMKTLDDEDDGATLSPEILGAVHLAGSRFERLLRMTG